LGDLTPRAIAELLEILNDGEWHMIRDVRSKMRLSENQIKRITEFLCEYQFIEVDKTKDRLKLKDTVRSFLFQTATS
jgi:hypothetical protein